MYQLLARPLQFYYELWPNYAGAIALLTLTIMLLLLPLTLKGTRSMLAMQRLQPELKKLQNKHRDDRQKLNEEVMKFYKENNINPMSGCMPLLLQMPVFFVLYRTLHDLINRAPFGYDMGGAAARSVSGVNGGVYEQFGVFFPKHLDRSSQLYQDLHSSNTMEAWGLNLAESAQKAFSQGLGHALPYILLVLAVAATSYIQQRQIAGRNTGAPVNPQQQMLMKLMPLMFSFISLTLPSGLVVYFLVSNLFRIGQQSFITRTMYRGEDGIIATTGKASDDLSTASTGGFMARLREAGLPDPGKAKADARAAKAAKTTTVTAEKPSPKGGSVDTKKPAAPSRTAHGPSRSAPTGANRSRAKKKRK